MNFKIDGRGYYNIFTLKHNLQSRLAKLLQRNVVNENYLSFMIYLGCVKKVEKFEKYKNTYNLQITNEETLPEYIKRR